MGWDVVLKQMERAKRPPGHLPSFKLPDQGSCCTQAQAQLLLSAWLSCGPSCLASVLRSMCGGLALFPSTYVAAARFYAFLSKQRMGRMVFQPGSSLESQQDDKQDR